MNSSPCIKTIVATLLFFATTNNSCVAAMAEDGKPLNKIGALWERADNGERLLKMTSLLKYTHQNELQKKCILQLLKFSANDIDINYSNDGGHTTPFSRAILEGQEEIIDAFLKHKELYIKNVLEERYLLDASRTIINKIFAAIELNDENIASIKNNPAVCKKIISILPECIINRRDLIESLNDATPPKWPTDLSNIVADYAVGDVSIIEKTMARLNIKENEDDYVSALRSHCVIS